MIVDTQNFKAVFSENTTLNPTKQNVGENLHPN